MADFRKVHGDGYKETNADFLRTENTQLKQALMQVQGELLTRAAPRVGELIDAVNQLVAAANQGHPGARDLLRKLTQTLESARDASSSIAIVRQNNV